LLFVITMKKREEDMVESVGGGGGTIDGSKLGRMDGCMRGRTWKRVRNQFPKEYCYGMEPCPSECVVRA